MYPRQIRKLNWAALLETQPGFIKPTKRTGKRLAGLAYEKKVRECLTLRFGEAFIPSPWFMYKEMGDNKVYYCQMDGFIIRLKHGQIILTEIKLSHTAKAYYQMHGLYKPILQHLFPEFEIRCLEIVRWFDPEVFFPGEKKMCADLLHAPASGTGIHITGEI